VNLIAELVQRGDLSEDTLEALEEIMQAEGRRFGWSLPHAMRP
jgi:hypothetical protein